MSLKCGIVGLPNVGKSTLFNALTRQQAAAENFPFCTIDPNVGTVPVPDERLQVLAGLLHPQKTTPAYVAFVDIAGLVKGASQGEGLGNQFLANIREVDAIVHVVRCFSDTRVVHVAGAVDPVFDKEIIEHELRCKDLETLDKRILKVQKVLKTGSAVAQKELALLKLCRDQLTQGANARDLELDRPQQGLAQSWQLLSFKPIIYVANVAEDDLKEPIGTYAKQLRASIPSHATCIPICTRLEAEMATLDREEQAFFAETYGLQDSGLTQLVRAAYTTLGLITYFTAGPQEVRAWTVQRGAQAPQAAGVIHSDFERRFIKAEVIKLADYRHYQTEAACRAAGKIHMEGKDYTVEDGDIIHFRCNTAS